MTTEPEQDRSLDLDVIRMHGHAEELVTEERLRQVAPKDTGGEAWSPEHDDAHSGGELALSAAAYATISTLDSPDVQPEVDRAALILATAGPCTIGLDAHEAPLRSLVKAGALILAEIERRLRAGETVD